MPQTLPIADFLAAPGAILDVRSPAEHEHGRIRDAISFPLFSNEERAQVGTCYKQQGRDEAVELGLSIVGPKLTSFVTQAKTLSPDRVVRVHCWRGGMRSGSMAWLLETAGFQVTVLDRGYKGFRHWAHAVLAEPKPIVTLGGMTGTGKTLILNALKAQGEQILDLEHLANHRGSSYGNLGLPPQPSTEQFENLIAIEWSQLSRDRPIWIEAESRMIGSCRVPDDLFQQMVAAPVLQVERSREERIHLLLEDYGAVEPEALLEATVRLKKRLGGDRTQQAVDCIQQGNLAAAVDLVLDYYDKAYRYDLKRRQVGIDSIDVTGLTDIEVAKTLVERSRQLANQQSTRLPDALRVYPSQNFSPMLTADR
ncbi:MAG: tRNA 2-selenouridine(34) synthase MnmH [Stenomitos rutilans HA7619-LM2]|jgi:tRNA 2-selenouridine synthase|nr:tRNA 2-selenouridine(34) synthase MnmH [Stenomitos rutilans HA7619-LM2]